MDRQKIPSVYCRYDMPLLQHQGPDAIQRCHLTSIGNPIVEIRRSYDCLISTIEFPILVRQHLYIESGTRASAAAMVTNTTVCLQQLYASHVFKGCCISLTVGNKIRPGQAFRSVLDIFLIKDNVLSLQQFMVPFIVMILTIGGSLIMFWYIQKNMHVVFSVFKTCDVQPILKIAGKSIYTFFPWCC